MFLFVGRQVRIVIKVIWVKRVGYGGRLVRRGWRSVENKAGMEGKLVFRFWDFVYLENKKQNIGEVDKGSLIFVFCEVGSLKNVIQDYYYFIEEILIYFFKEKKYYFRILKKFF